MEAEQGLARIDRLDRLVLGLMTEQAVIGKGQDPLLYLERRAYLKALGVAVRGLESARVVLAKARQRIMAK
jgi:hypothetical protein